MLDSLFMHFVGSTFRITIATIFIISSSSKLRHPQTFTAAVARYHLLPPRWTRPFALSLAWLELTLGLLLLFGWQTRFAALASIGLFLLFLVAMGINLVRGRKDLDCGCSGKKHAQKIGWRPITRNIILILLALPLTFWGGGFLALDNQSPAVQKFVLETLILNNLLPLALSGVGLVFLSRLLKQTVRLVMLTPVDIQTLEVAENFRSLNPVQVEVQK